MVYSLGDKSAVKIKLMTVFFSFTLTNVSCLITFSPLTCQMFQLNTEIHGFVILYLITLFKAALMNHTDEHLRMYKVQAE